jgi:cyanophycinase
VDVTLIGGGWADEGQRRCLTPFLDAARRRAGDSPPKVGFVWVDELDGTDWDARWIALVSGLAPIEATSIAVPIGKTLDPNSLDGIDALFVCGGLTPAYAAALQPAAAHIRDLVGGGTPYAGSSAGGAVAARTAVVGGYLDRGRVVCPEDSAEDLEEISVVAGLGLVAEMVDVHASAWGTLPRLAAALELAPDVAAGIGLDEDTAWHVVDASVEVLGRNAAHVLTRDGDGFRWQVRVASSGAR